MRTALIGRGKLLLACLQWRFEFRETRPKGAHFLPPDLFYAEFHFFLEPNAHPGV